MRNAFVVLVPLCIGVAVGFIAPAGLKKTETGSMFAENTIAKLSTSVNSINPRLEVPSKTESISRKSILDVINNKEMYEHGNGKENIVNERSFLFLNQRYKKPHRSQQLVATSCDIFDQSPKEEGAEQISSVPFKFSNSYFDEPHKHFVNPTKLEKITSSYFASSSNCNLKDDKNTPKNERQNYLELLKEPILRPASNQNQNKDNRYKAYNKAQVKINDARRKYISSQKSTPDNRQSAGGMVKNFGFTRPYMIHRPVFHKELDAIDTNFLNDDYVQRVLSNSGDDKLLDRFLKATLADQAPKDHHYIDKKIKCNHHNCILMSTRPDKELHGHEADCKCGQWLHTKSQVGRERLQRDELKVTESHTTMPSMSNELDNYEDILTSNSYTNKPDHVSTTIPAYKSYIRP